MDFLGDRGYRMGRRRRCRIVYIYISIMGIMLLLHALAWSSKWFCDWYAIHVFWIWVETYGRAMGMVPFSVGEILIGLGAGFAVAGALLGLTWVTGKIADWRRKRRRREAVRLGGARQEADRSGAAGQEADESGVIGQEQPGRLQRFCRTYCMVFMWILLAVFVLMTLNCYLLYHTSGFEEKYLEASAAEYSLAELEALRNFVVEQCNALCCQIPRNEDGSLSYEGDMGKAAGEAMGKLGEAYGQLGGF